MWHPERRLTKNCALSHKPVNIGKRSQSSLPEAFEYGFLVVIFKAVRSRKSLVACFMREVHQHPLQNKGTKDDSLGLGVCCETCSNANKTQIFLRLKGQTRVRTELAQEVKIFWPKHIFNKTKWHFLSAFLFVVASGFVVRVPWPGYQDVGIVEAWTHQELVSVDNTMYSTMWLSFFFFSGEGS